MERPDVGRMSVCYLVMRSGSPGSWVCACHLRQWLSAGGRRQSSSSPI